MSTLLGPKLILGVNWVGLIMHKDVGAETVDAILTASLWSVQMPACFLLAQQQG